MKKDIINHTITLTLSLDVVAKDFKYNLEADSHDDVYHGGYNKSDIRKMKLMLPLDLNDKLALLFPSEVAQALEDSERSAIAEAIVKHQKNALEEALLKIDLSAGGAEYTTGDLESISSKAGIKSVVIDSKENTIQVEVLNPEHLINTMIHGMGRIYPDLDPYDSAEKQDIISRFHNLNDYFNIYGESKPSGELPSHDQGSVDDEYFKSLIKENISNLTLEEVADAVLDYVDVYSDEDRSELLSLVTTYTDYQETEVKEEVRKILKDKQNCLDKEIESWN